MYHEYIIYPEYIMRNAGLDETQAGIKIAGRNINNLRYADNTKLIKSLLMKVKDAKAFDCVDHNKLENSERDGNTRAPDLPLEKSVCRSGSNS